MPFGAAISCAHFQSFSNAVAHIMRVRTKKDNVNYLDDFLFIALLAYLCNSQITTFLEVCEKIRFPVAMDKTCWASTVITFLGMLLNTEDQTISIPTNKLDKALAQIETILANKKRKATVIQIQQLCGLLNFICHAIVPGRPFLMRLYNSLQGTRNKLKPYHHIKLAQDTILDLQVWKLFLKTPEAYCRPFLDFSTHLNAITDLDWCTDAAKAIGKGFGGHLGSFWFAGVWDEHFLKDKDPSIEFLELYALTVGVLLWTKIHPNQRIILFCDNQSVVHMINNQSSKCRNCMTLIRIITFECLMRNVRLYARHIGTKSNDRADALSRDRIPLFFKLSRAKGIQVDDYPMEIPEILLDIQSWWIN